MVFFWEISFLKKIHFEKKIKQKFSPKTSRINVLKKPFFSGRMSFLLTKLACAFLVTELLDF